MGLVSLLKDLLKGRSGSYKLPDAEVRSDTERAASELCSNQTVADEDHSDDDYTDNVVFSQSETSVDLNEEKHVRRFANLSNTENRRITKTGQEICAIAVNNQCDDAVADDDNEDHDHYDEAVADDDHSDKAVVLSLSEKSVDLNAENHIRPVANFHILSLNTEDRGRMKTGQEILCTPLQSALKKEKLSFALVRKITTKIHGKIALRPIELERANDNYVGPFIVTCNGVEVPGFLTSAFDFLEKNGYDKIEGVFRKEGNWKRTNEIRKVMEEHGGSFEDVEHPLTVHDVCCMVKKYLAKYRILSEIEARDGRDWEVNNIMNAVNNLASHKKATLAYLMGKLNKLQQQTSCNRMDSHSLAVLFNPCLFGSDNFDSIQTTTPLFTQRVRIIEILIKNYGCIKCGQFEKRDNQNLRKLAVSSVENGNQKRVTRISISDIATTIQKCFRRVTRRIGPSTRNKEIRFSHGIMTSKKAPVTLQMNSACKSRIANGPKFCEPALTTANAARSAVHAAFDEDSTHKQCLFTSTDTTESEHDCEKAKHTSMRIQENWVGGTEFFQNLSKRIPKDESEVMRESVCRLKQLAVVSSLQRKWEEVTVTAQLR